MQHVNLKYRRTGTLWEGRHKASLVEEEVYLLACYRYIELNPVRANMVAHPAEYPWSSFAENTGVVSQNLTSRHALYQSLGQDSMNREVSYRALFDIQLGPELLNDIRKRLSFRCLWAARFFKIKLRRRWAGN